jgi:predicted DNA binding CopG/RHH family protein
MKEPLVMSEVEKIRTPKDTVENYEFQPKDTVLTMRLSGALLDKAKEQAKLKNMDYQKYIRLILEKNIKED